jgi:hypothetical protein
MDDPQKHPDFTAYMCEHYQGFDFDHSVLRVTGRTLLQIWIAAQAEHAGLRYYPGFEPEKESFP